MSFHLAIIWPLHRYLDIGSLSNSNYILFLKLLTSSVSQSEIVTFAVYLLGGDQKFIDTEDVAVKAHEIAPGRFVWRKYPDQINLELVRVYLSDAKKPDKGEHLSGSGRKGWSLTSKGRQWIEANLNLLERDLSLGDGISRAGSVDAVRLDRESKRLQATDAWRLWNVDNKTVTAAQAKQVFRIDSYTKPNMLSLKIDRLLNLFSDNKEITEFLSEMSQLLRRSEKQ